MTGGPHVYQSLADNDLVSTMNPKTKMLVVIAAVVAAVAAIAFIVSNNNSVPSTAVAVVDGTELTKADLNTALKVQASGSDAAATGAISDQIVARLIQDQWVLKEAAEKGIAVPEPEVQTELDKLKEATFGGNAAYQKFLQENGQSEEDLKQIVRARVAQKLLLAEAMKNTPITVSERRAYYNQHIGDFNRTNSRDIRIVFTKSKKTAELAAQKLRSGASWKVIAQKYSEDAGTKSNGGKSPAVKKGQLEKKINNAIFSAKKNVVVGPIKSQFGYYVFQVEKVLTPKQVTFEAAVPEIDLALKSTLDARANTQLQNTLSAHWKDKTNCAKGYIVASCSNASDAVPRAPAPTGATGK